MEGRKSPEVDPMRVTERNITKSVQNTSFLGRLKTRAALAVLGLSSAAAGGRNPEDIPTAPPETPVEIRPPESGDNLNKR